MLFFRNRLAFIGFTALFFLQAFQQTVMGQSQFSGLPFVRNYAPSDYNAGIQNYKIVQDKRGLVYVANNYGLLEYDGLKWKTYSVNGTKVRDVAVDSRGRVYVACQGDFGYFFPNATGRLVFTSLADSLPKKYRSFDETWNVFIGQEQVYFTTSKHIFIYSLHGIDVISPDNAMEFSFFENRQLYVNQRFVGIGMLEGSKIHNIPGGSVFGGYSVRSILPIYGNGLLISTVENGIFTLRDGNVTVWNPSNQIFFREANINCMIRLRNGNLAVGTQNHGLLLLDTEGNILSKMTRGQGLLNRTILSLLEDDLSNLWVCQINGIAYAELGSPFTVINEQMGLPGTGYAAYFTGDQLLLGTNTGLYSERLSQKGKFTMIPNSRGQIYHLGVYQSDLLIGHHNGPMRLELDQAIQVSKEQGSWMFLPLHDFPNIVIEGAYNGLYLYKLVDKHLKLSKKMHGFDESSRVMAEDKDGKIWVTHGYKGAYRITMNESRDSILRVSFYGDKKGFPSNRQINVFRLGSDLIFTAENGVFKYDPESDGFVADGLFSKTFGQHSQFWHIQQDGFGNIYFIGREHIGVFRKNTTGGYSLETKEFNRIRKYLNDDLQNLTIIKNDELLFGARDGFIHYNPNYKNDIKPNFNALIRTVTTRSERDSVLFDGTFSRNDSVVVSQTIEAMPVLSYNSNSINFTYTATSFEGDGAIEYQCYLENYDKNWSDWNASTIRAYTNLRERNYVFHVRARSVNGDRSPEATYKFTINPPWYRSSWAYAIDAFTIVAALFAGFVFLDRKYKHQQMLMSLKQEKELNRKDNEMERLSLQSQEKINRLQHEKYESEIDHMKNELATATMHLLNKNEFISGIKNKLVQIAKKATREDLSSSLNVITKDIENNISDDSDWEHFQFHFDRVHGDFTARLKVAFTDLSPQETKLSAYLRMNLSSKEIAQLLNISVRGVEISRYRLRKKLKLDRAQNLQEFILGF